MTKNLLCISALLCLSLAAAGKQYSVSFSTPVQVGSVKLAPGDYKVKVDGANAVFTDNQKKTFTAPVKVEKVTRKPENTAVETKETNGVQQVNTIDLSGADFKLVF